MISDDNSEGIDFRPIVATANATADMLRSRENVDAVIALTHIGYNPAGLVGDSVLARNSRGIDIIIGGHSHDVIDPATERVPRAAALPTSTGRRCWWCRQESRV